jgi:hypothetical protein
MGGRTIEATGRELNGDEERRAAKSAYGPVAGWYDYVDYANFVWSIPTRGRLLRVHDQWFEEGIPVVIELSDPE